jgi:NAD+--asparagine ADP-ribosyltransferase
VPLVVAHVFFTGIKISFNSFYNSVIYIYIFKRITCFSNNYVKISSAFYIQIKKLYNSHRINKYNKFIDQGAQYEENLCP